VQLVSGVKTSTRLNTSEKHLIFSEKEMLLVLYDLMSNV